MTPDPGLDDILRRQKRRARKRRRKRGGFAAVLAVLAVLIVLVCVGLGSAYTFSSGCDLSSLHTVEIGQNSFVFAADNSLLGAIPAERNREPVPLSAVSPWVAKSTVAIEDRRFWSHGGVDPKGIARALWADVRSGKVVQGGSTITQQLVSQPLHLPGADVQPEAQGGLPRDQAEPRLVEEANPRRRT